VSARDAKNLKASPLLEQTLLDVRRAWIDEMIDCAADELLGAQAKVRALDEFAETLNERIQQVLDDAGDGPAE
jgi:hypothetical protein